MNKFVGMLVGVGLTVGATVGASASVTFDFTSNANKNANGQTSYDFGAGVISANAKMNTQEKNTPALKSLGGYNLALDFDGIGIRNDEVEGSEKLTVTFDDLQTVTGLAFLDLFKRNSNPFDDNQADDANDNRAEQVNVTFFSDLGVTSIFSISDHDIRATQTGGQNPGGYFAFTNLNVSGVKQVSFMAPGGNKYKDDRNNDFALAAVQVSAVPEPATWLMMLAGFALTGFALKRRKGFAAAA